MNDFSKQAQEMADKVSEQVKSLIPHNKNAYEIRAQVLSMAQEMTQFEFNVKYMTWEQGVERDENGRMLDNTGSPKVPNAKDVLKTAKEYYDFINTK